LGEPGHSKKVVNLMRRLACPVRLSHTAARLKLVAKDAAWDAAGGGPSYSSGVTGSRKRHNITAIP